MRLVALFAVVLAMLFVVPRLLLDAIDEDATLFVIYFAIVLLIIAMLVLFARRFLSSSEVQTKIVINRPLDRVFSFVATNYSQNRPQWASVSDPSMRITLEKTSPGPLAQGSTGVEFISSSVGRSQWDYKVVELLHNSRLALESTQDQLGAKMQLIYNFRPVGEATELTFKVRLAFPNKSGMVAPFANVAWRKGYEDSARRLKAVVEAEIPA